MIFNTNNKNDEYGIDIKVIKSEPQVASNTTNKVASQTPKTVTSVGSYAFGYKYVDNQYTRENNFTEISGYPSTAAQTYCTNYNVPFKS